MPVRTLKGKLEGDLIKLEMQGAGTLAGYRYIWHSLHLKHHVNVLRSLVASILKEIDPEGKLRRRKKSDMT